MTPDHFDEDALRRLKPKLLQTSVMVSRHKSAHPDWPDLMVGWQHIPSMRVKVVVAAEPINPPDWWPRSA